MGIFKFIILFIVAEMLCNHASSKPPGKLAVQSPDGKIKISVVASSSQFTYSVSVDNKVIINPSRIGLQLNNDIALGSKVSVINTTNRRNNSTWNNAFGNDQDDRRQL